MEIQFPVRVRLTPMAISELINCEYGSYEDHILADGTRLEHYADGSLHAVEIAQRFKTFIEMRDQYEIDEILGQSATGTWSMYHLHSAMKLYDALIPLASPKAQKWIGPPTGM